MRHSPTTSSRAGETKLCMISYDFCMNKDLLTFVVIVFRFDELAVALKFLYEGWNRVPIF